MINNSTLPYDDAYDPRIQAHIDSTDLRWGDPRKNRERLIPYGIKFIDEALYGIDPDGELIVIQGEEKNRKTTMAANVLANIMRWERLKDKPVINIDSLESGMRPEKYTDVLLSMMATDYILRQGHVANGFCKACDKPECTQLGISPKFLKYNNRSPLQKTAIDFAKTQVYSWPLLIHGASLKQGNTRNMEAALRGSKKQKARWIHLYEKYGMKILVIDHVQQYSFETDLSDYEKQIRAIGGVADFVSQYGTACLMLSQVSLTSVREVRSGATQKLTAAGGSKAAQEANTVFSVSYKPGSGVMRVKIEESRDAGSFSVYQRLDDSSGVFYGTASTEPF